MPLLVSGCSTYLYVALFNNTATVVTVVGTENNVDVPPGGEVTFRVVRDIELRMGGEQKQYKYPVVPGEYYELHKVLWHRIKLQVQPNGELRILKPDEEFPAAPDIDQPDGFPLHPIDEQSNKALQTELGR